MAAKEQLLKLLVVGASGTGKTCLIRQYVHNVFQPTNKITIGVDFALKVLAPTNTTLQIWDIAGQERYGQMTRVYFQAAVGAMVVCDITDPESYETAVKWKQDVDGKVFLPNTMTPIPCILLLNKADLGGSKMTKEQLDAFCQQNGFVRWFAVSAKDATNVDAAFEALVEEVQKVLPTAQSAGSAAAKRDEPNAVRGLGQSSAQKKPAKKSCCDK